MVINAQNVDALKTGSFTALCSETGYSGTGLKKAGPLVCLDHEMVMLL